jgi:hypothetical protein
MGCEDPNNPRLIRYTYFANVHVGAIRVQLGVIVREEGCVHIVGRGHNVAIVIGLHHVRSRAIVARSPQAQGLARKEVRTIRVDPRVYDRKLIATNRSGLGGMSRLRSHVDTLLAADIESQISPSRTVYVRVHGVARAVVIVSEEKSLRQRGPTRYKHRRENHNEGKNEHSRKYSVVKRGNDKNVIKRVTVLAYIGLACEGIWLVKKRVWTGEGSDGPFKLVWHEC